MLLQLLLYLQVTKKEGKKGRKERGKIRKSNQNTTKGGPLVTKLGASLLCFLKNFVVFPTTFKFQGLAPIWVQLPKELYTKNMYKNHIFVRPRFANEQCLHLK
jgi:hypothetical protein